MILSRNMKNFSRTVLMIVAGAFAGCNCGEKALESHGPEISVTPNPVVVASATVNEAASVVLNVSNIGSSDLILSGAPTVVDVSAGVQFAVTDVLVNDCTGKPRQTSDLMDIGIGLCAQVTLRYLASQDGTFHGTLQFLSNDTGRSPYDVPITISALTPHVQACAFDGTTMLGCNKDGQPLALSFGSTPIQVGTSATRTIQLVSIGTMPVTVSSESLSGDADYVLSPGPQSFMSESLSPMQSSTVTVTLTPSVGGPRIATVTFATSDPVNPTLKVQLSAQGDGPALCYCIGTSQTSCENTMPTMAFGPVGITTSSVLNLYLNSCGTEPLTFTNAAETSGTPAFTAMNLPAAGTMLAAGQTIAVPVTFTPPAAMAYTGSLSFQTMDGEKPLISLTGTGVNSGCNLQAASMTLDFGQVAKGVTATQMYVLANTGTQPCYFPMAPAITTGSSLFAVGAYPVQPLDPSRTATITVTYTPQTTSGTDMGTMAVYYSGTAMPTPAQLETMNVNLVGEPVATATCKLSTSPNATSMFGGALNFGEVGLNRPKTLPIVLRNVGSAPCQIGQATINPGSFSSLLGSLGGGVVGPSSAFTIAQQPTVTTLAPGDTTSITVQFLPTDEEQYGSPFGMIGLNIGGAMVQIQTSDTTTFNPTSCMATTLGGPTPPSGCAAWGLSGQGVQSTIQVLPNTVNFGEITLGCSSPEQNVTIYNVGNSAIHIYGFSIDPAPPPTVFTVIAPPASMSVPIAIAAGGELAIQVKYTPTMTGIQTASLYIDSDAVTSGSGSGSSSNPYVTVSLTGTGVTDSMQTDVFQQTGHQQIDMLWVIDQDANSMGDKQQQISTNAMAFIQAANNAGTDYHLGVISNWDVDAMPEPSSNYPNIMVDPATLFNVSAPQAWVQDSDSNPEKEFSQNVMIGTNTQSTGEEGSLQAMFMALSAPLITTGANAGFLRDQASLVVISISDDDDVNSPYSADFYAAFLQSLKPGNPQSAIFDTVGGELPGGPLYDSSLGGCPDTNGDGQDDAPEKYAAVSMATGGKLYDMCTGQWSTLASDLAIGSFGGQTHFVLSRPCDPTTLTVTVTSSSGAVTMETMGSDYTFNATLNAIDFGTAPPVGSTITATYDAECL